MRIQNQYRLDRYSFDPDDGLTLGALSHTSIRQRLTGLKAIDIELTAEEIL